MNELYRLDSVSRSRDRIAKEVSASKGTGAVILLLSRMTGDRRWRGRYDWETAGETGRNIRIISGP